ncbi:MAG TPA: MerR family transcriptional regulator [Anaerolineales bacterium]|nr:MerR family transcriptional regulator [Anaerolineales bacterium]
MLTVKQLSKLAGVTPRTLHHYDEIGLLKPSRVGNNGYRYYGEESLLRLQQILFYRELDIPLEDIKKIMGRRDFDVLGALQSHKDALRKQVTRLNRLITTVDNTINHLKGNIIMSDKSYFDGFSEEEQEEYALEAEELYGAESVRASMKKWKAYSADEKKRIMEEGSRNYADMIAVMPKGADSPEAQVIVERWRKHIDYFWTPNLDELLALANGYNDDPRFKANFDKMHPQLAEFMLEAVKVYVEKRK